MTTSHAPDFKAKSCWRLPDRDTWTVGLGITLGLASCSVGPWIIGGLVETHRFDIERASLTVTVEQMTMGAVMFVLAGNLHRLPRRSLIVIGVLLALISQVLSYLVVGFGPMAASRVLSGVAFAFIYSISTAFGAATRDPDRTFAVAQGMGQIATLALYPMIGIGSMIPGHKGVFIILAFFSLLLAVPFLALALRHQPAPVERGAHPKHPVALLSKTVIGVLAVMTVYSVATGGTWNFMERVAASVGLSGARLGSGLVVTSLIGTLGSVLANRLGTTYGRIWPLCGGLVMLGLATLWFMTANSSLQFWAAVSLWAFLFTFTTPYVFGLAAAADPSGRVVAATGTAYIIVSAAGTYVGAFVVAHFSMTVFGAIALTILAATAVHAAVISRMVAAARALTNDEALSSYEPICLDSCAHDEPKSAALSTASREAT